MSAIVDRLTAALEARYRIERELGEGGMATVYLADDVRHDRRVALKVLKPELAAVVGAERFLGEIKTTANLQHPHILPLFDSGEADSFLFYVMPYVEGESLRDKLNRERQLPVQEAVALASKLASALDYAHENGVVHRDIKPANILLSRGEPLVADFGIALALGAAGGGRLTETGLSLGTPYYMSPEQATGDQQIGPASDIYAVGCVLYEMLVGDPPFGGSTAQAVLGKIIAGEAVNPARRRGSIPPNVDAAIRKALERLPADRFTSGDDFARALRDPGFRYGEAGSEGVRSAVRHPVTLGALAVAAASLVVAGWALTRSSSETRDLGLPHDAPMRFGASARALAVSPDGSFMVYEAQEGPTSLLWYRSPSGVEARPIRGTEGAFGTPRISPDGSRVAFAAEGELRIADIAGGSVTTVGEVNGPTGGGWTEEGGIFLSDEDGTFLRWFDPESGLVREEPISYCLYPQALGGERFLCSGGSDKYAFERSVSQPLEVAYWTRSADAGRPGSTIRGAGFRMVDDSYLVYMAVDGTLMAAPVRSMGSRTVGRSVSLVPDVRRESYTGEGQYDLTEDGTLVYVPGINAEIGRLVRASAGGAIEPLNVDDAAHLRFRLSPDGRSLATVIDGVEKQELRLYDLRTGSHETIEEAFFIGPPVWSPDGTGLVYKVRVEENPSQEILYLRRIDSAAESRILLQDPEGLLGFQPSSFYAPDSLLVGVGVPGASAMLLDPTADPVRVDSLGISSLFLSLSPDRRWLAWSTLGSGGVQLQPWPELNRRYPVHQTGNEPQWLSDGRLVFYDPSPGAGAVTKVWPFYQVTIEPDAERPVGETRVFVADPRFLDTPGWSHAPDNQGGLIYLQSPEENVGFYVRVIPGWVDEMKRRVDEANR